MTVRINLEKRKDAWEIVDILYTAYEDSSTKIADNVNRKEIVYFHKNRQEMIRNHITAILNALTLDQERRESQNGNKEST